MGGDLGPEAALHAHAGAPQRLPHLRRVRPVARPVVSGPHALDFVAAIPPLPHRVREGLVDPLMRAMGVNG